MTLRLLALDAATDTAHLGVQVGERTLVRSLPAGAASSASLLPAIQALLAEAGISLRQLDAIGFGHGPGAFTGLRTACSVAQGLAFGADRPLVALDTLAAIADAAVAQGAPTTVWSVLDARMGEVYAARWQRGDAGWICLDAPALHTPGDFLARCAAAPAARAGAAWRTLAALSDTCGNDAVWADATPDGASLLRLTASAHARGAFIDPALALPLYVRNQVALTSAQRAEAAQVAAAAATARAAAAAAA